MTVGPFPWQETQWQRFLTAHAAGRLPHGLLLLGAEGIGVREFAEALARRLLCGKPATDGKSCGSCPDCVQFDAGTHPDSTRIEPETEGKAIGVDAIRSLIEHTTLRSSRDAKVGLICPADAMTTAAANSLLKTLEEPPPGTHLLLVCRRLRRVPATVRSRCQRIDFPLPDSEPAKAWLADQGITHTGEWLLRAGGRPLTAAAEMPSESEDPTAPVRALLRVVAGQALPAAVAPELRGSDLRQLIPSWAAAMEDILRLRHHADAPVRHETLRDGMQRLAQRLDERRVFLYLDTLYRSIPGPSSSLNADMQIEGLLADAAGLRKSDGSKVERSHG